jgi:Ferritin-like domain/TAT (twin-arginine translocation) pathway signal sequence
VEHESGEEIMKQLTDVMERSSNRRSFLKKSLVAGAAATVGASVLGKGLPLAAQTSGNTGMTKGDVAILRFLAAAELIESDLWIQYAELGGIGKLPPIEVDPTETLNPYQVALSNLDPDGPQYITSNTLDEISHATFINAYLESKGAAPVDFTQFETLPGSIAHGSSGKPRLTNLMSLNVDTSWYVRYRSTQNPDLGATFPQAITLNGVTAIPRTDADYDGKSNPNFLGNDHIQAIANVAAFHFGAIEQGGTSLYATLSQKVTSPEVLMITLGIGADEVAHFLEWVDFAGNGVQPMIAPFTDPITGLTFPNFFSPLNKSIQPSLIFPVPFELIPGLPNVAAIRPLTDQFSGAMAAVKALTDSGLFIGQVQEFFNELNTLAAAADAAQRGV